MRPSVSPATVVLPAAAQAAIGQAHPGTAVLAGLLRQAGLRPDSHIRIDDGGPVLAAPLDALTPAHLAAPTPRLP